MSEGGEETRVGRKRRSWFEQPKGVCFNVAVDQNEHANYPNPTVENIEVLELTHFTRPTVVDFGKVKVGQEKTCHVIVRNPQQYLQQVC